MSSKIISIEENPINSDEFTQTYLTSDIKLDDGIRRGIVQLLLVRDNKDTQRNLIAYIDQSDDWSISPTILRIKDMGYGDNIEQNDFIFIDHILVDSEFRNEGVGSQTLKEIIGYAKENNFKQIILTPRPIEVIQNNGNREEFKKGERRLINWYSRFGFVEYKNNINNKYTYMKLNINDD